MDNLFVWIVMFAGAAIVLLAIFLVASEKELKIKRREIEELLTRLENSPQGNPVAQLSTPQRDNSAELTELRASKQELENQLSTLSGKLELSRRTIEELQATQHGTAAARAATLEVHTANERLKEENNELRSRLQASEARTTGSAADNQDAAERHARLQSEMMDLKHKLEESHAKLREFEGLQQKLASFDALEEKYREERLRMESRIAELEREISTGREKVRESETLRNRLVESERNQETLRNESRQRDEEIAHWRERVAEGEENRRRLASLQAPYDALISKQTALAERQREFQEELAGFARMIATTQENPSISSSPHSPSPGNEHSSIQAHNDAAVSPERKPTRRFGIFSGVIVLAAAALLAAQYLSPNAGESTAPVVIASAPRVTAPAAQPVKSLAGAKTQPTPSESSTVSPIAKEAAKPVKASKPTELAKQESPAVSTYEITQPSRVYAAPNELSQLIGEIEPGVRVNVVNARDGWLEIHSKHGRPPGFIRREGAARIAGRN
jgi:predicted  nucleic acid-binding Zn-ribbon protein